jgi:translation initiation factor 4G
LIRTEEELGRVLEEHKLTFLLPLLHIRAEIWRQLETHHPTPEAFLAWLGDTVPPPHQTDPAFILALVHNILRYVTERTTTGGEGADAAAAIEKEKELMVSFKPVLQAFIKNSPALQLTAVYAMQVR